MSVGKIRYHRMLAGQAAIRPYLPRTAYCTEKSVAQYLNRYSAVYIKPDGGGRGEGVIKAWKANSTYYYVKEKGHQQKARSVKELYAKLGLKRRPHVVQQAIDLARINGRPYDIRLMMMRDASKQWKVIGTVAKVAGPGSVISNIARGKGYTLPLDTALRESLGLSAAQMRQKKREMNHLASMCTRVYSKRRYDWQIGYDLAIDRKAKVWFIEMNPTVPAHRLFKKQPSIYREIKKLASFHKRKK